MKTRTGLIACALLAVWLPLEAAAWTAYNDLMWTNGQSTAANVTHYAALEGGGNQSLTNEGTLVDFWSGVATPVTVKILNGGQSITTGRMPDPGTDAHTVFSGIVNAVGTLDYHSLPTPCTITFSNLPITDVYEFVILPCRAGTAYGLPGSQRVGEYTISGADTFLNTSTPGASFLNAADPSVVITGGYNVVDGYVGRWENIDPGADGVFTITITDGGSAVANKGVYANAFMLRDEVATFTVIPIVADSDDAEEFLDNNAMYLGSGDLEMPTDTGPNPDRDQKIGMRFTNIPFTQGVTVVDAYVQFTVNNNNAPGAISLSIQGEATDNASTFTTTAGNITARLGTVTTVLWSPPDWTTIGNAGVAQRTPNIAGIIQDIIDRPGWAKGNALALFVTGPDGTAINRNARSHDNGDGSDAPVLCMKYSSEALREAGTIIQLSMTEPKHAPTEPDALPAAGP